MDGMHGAQMAVEASSRVQSAKERAIIAAVRLACLSYHCPLPASEAVQYALDEVCGADRDLYEEVRDIVDRIVHHLTDPRRLAIERVQRAVANLSGSHRIVAAYIANAGVLSPADVEGIIAQ